MPALADRIARLLDNAALRAEMGRAARRRAEDTFSWPNIIGRYEALWDDLASRAAAGPVPAAVPRVDARDLLCAALGIDPSRLLHDRLLLQLGGLVPDPASPPPAGITPGIFGAGPGAAHPGRSITNPAEAGPQSVAEFLAWCDRELGLDSRSAQRLLLNLIAGGWVATERESAAR